MCIVEQPIRLTKRQKFLQNLYVIECKGFIGNTFLDKHSRDVIKNIEVIFSNIFPVDEGYVYKVKSYMFVVKDGKLEQPKNIKTIGHFSTLNKAKTFMLNSMGTNKIVNFGTDGQAKIESIVGLSLEEQPCFKHKAIYFTVEQPADELGVSVKVGVIYVEQLKLDVE